MGGTGLVGTLPPDPPPLPPEPLLPPTVPPLPVVPPLEPVLEDPPWPLPEPPWPALPPCPPLPLPAVPELDATAFAADFMLFEVDWPKERIAARITNTTIATRSAYSEVS